MKKHDLRTRVESTLRKVKMQQNIKKDMVRRFNTKLKENYEENLATETKKHTGHHPYSLDHTISQESFGKSFK